MFSTWVHKKKNCDQFSCCANFVRRSRKKNSMDFPSGHHPFASGQHHFASGENNCKKFFAIPQYPHPYIIFWQIKTPDFIFQLLSIISHPFGFILQQTPIQNYSNACDCDIRHCSERSERTVYRFEISRGLRSAPLPALFAISTVNKMKKNTGRQDFQLRQFCAKVAAFQALWRQTFAT